MAVSSKSSRVTFIVLRFMRKPILILVSVYATSMVGWVLIPGVNAAGEPERLSFFHAFYFLAYTATTTGFGEIPYAFSEAQRMWGIVSLYSSVIAWLYAVGSIIHLIQNPHYQQARAERRFAKGVRRVSEPFYILCGFGNTGSLLTRGLSDAGKTVVVLDQDPERIKALALRDYPVMMPGLCADARVPEHLIEAGLLWENCEAVIALTHDEEVNLKISVTARLLNPDVCVVTHSTSPAYEETLAALGGDVHIIDPFQTYAKYLGATIANPSIHMLNQWLAGTRGAALDKTLIPPKGHWILCGYGRMGRWIDEALGVQGITTAVIEPVASGTGEAERKTIAGRANRKTLTAAGAERAAGLVAGTNNDSDNLSILIAAKSFNPDMFLVVRQNRHRNEVVFRAAQADLIMQPSLVSARRILFLLIAPLLKTFFESMREAPNDSETPLIDEAIRRLRETVGGTRPRIWTIEITPESAGALMAVLDRGGSITLGDLLRDPIDRQRDLACVPLVVDSGTEATVLPPSSYAVRAGDQILFCGSPRAYQLLDATLNNEYTLHYLVHGTDEPRSYALQWLKRKLSDRRAPGPDDETRPDLSATA